MRSQPIGVFDSGFGGLSVLQVLVQEFPSEEFIYLGDTARIPYGVKSSATVSRYLNQNLALLLKHECKAVVVACNTASSVLDPSKYDIPVIGVITPGAALAASTTTNKRVGVIATRATVLSKAYVTEIQKVDSAIEVFQNAGPLLVPLVEENWIDDPITNLVVFRYISPLISNDIDTLVLGCTHYPFLLKSIEKAVGASVNIVRSGPAVALHLRRALKEKQLLRDESSKDRSIRLLTTDVGCTYKEMAARFTQGLDIGTPELVEL